jgi:hypothetical protein
MLNSLDLMVREKDFEDPNHHDGIHVFQNEYMKLEEEEKQKKLEIEEIK